MSIKALRVLAISVIALAFAASCATGASVAAGKKAPFLPPEGKRYLIAGQDLGAVGGLPGYTEGYADYIGVPSGVTAYTSTVDYLGMDKVDNWGSGDSCAKLYVDSPAFKDAFLALGVYMSGDLDNILAGKRDATIMKLGAFVKAAGRPVFLRLGYEFNGPWNAYDPAKFVAAWRVIVDGLRADGVANFATVWQSEGSGTKDELMKWYPGDSYVDWVGYSFFDMDPSAVGQGILDIARERGKPAMICESTPKRDLSVGDEDAHWAAWFAPFFAHVDRNADVVRAVAYINVRWMDQPMWKNQGWGDSRVQVRGGIMAKWRTEISKPAWVHGPLVAEPRKYAFTADELKAIEAAKAASDTTTMPGALEAEDMEMAGNAKAYPDAGASGGYGAAYIMAAGDSVSFKAAAAAEALTVRYASQNAGTLGVYVDGVRKAAFDFPATGSWLSAYKVISVAVAIPAGAKVAIGFAEGDKAMNIDWVLLGKPGAVPAPPAPAAAATLPGAIEAEGAVLLGEARPYEDPAASGGSGVAYVMKAGDGIAFKGFGPAAGVGIRYASGLAGTLGVYLNGKRVADFSFPGTGGWVKDYAVVVVRFSIPAGSEVSIRFDEGDKAANIDCVFPLE